ncbi:MAG: hypothetical protein MdMp014T_2780 [Treponematales bacterium]
MPGYNPALPLSQQDYQTLNLRQMSFQNLIKASVRESENLNRLVSNLKGQQTKSGEQIRLLEVSLQKSQDALGMLQTALSQVGERLQEANEDLAASYDYMDSIERENKRLKRGAAIGFCFGAAGCFGGTPLLAEGLRTGDAKLALSGAAVIAGTSGIWAAGHFLFHWW